MNRSKVPPRWVVLVTAIITLVGGLLFAQTAATAPASALSGSQFQAGDIISDANFFDANAMSESAIQSFLNGKISSCSTGNCLNILTQDTTSRAAAYSPQGSLVCTAYQGATGETAAAIIYKVEQACSVSAKVILVTLQKEEGLVTATSVSAATLERAMGYGCPDSANGACDSLYYGFYNQVYMAAWQMRRYGTATPVGNYQPGVNFIQYSPNAACGGSNVNITDRATAALYNYTPYQPDAAALNNLGSTGDSCSSYGNRNFWTYYSEWFGDPTVPPGTPEGNLTAVTPSPNSLTISGWSVDPDDVTGTVPVSVQIDSSWYALSANQVGADLSSQYPGAGTAHYFTGTYALSAGNHTLCVYLVNAGGAGGQGTLGCQVVSIPITPAPVGAITTTSSANGTISFAGWAVRPDAPTAPVHLAINFGTTWTALTTGDPNAVAPTQVTGAGPDQGFSGSFAAPAGSQSFCVWASPTQGAAIQLACATVTVAPPAPAQGAIDSITAVAGGVSVAGWDAYPTSPSTSVGMAIEVGTAWTSMTANQPSTEAQTAIPGIGANHGFAATISLAPGTYSVCIWTDNPDAAATNMGCKSVTVLAAQPTQAHVDSITATSSGVSFAGWAVWPSSPTSSVNIAIQIGSNWYGFTANTASTEAAAAVPGAGPNHGFTGSIALGKGTYQVCVWAGAASGSATEVGCQSVTVAAVPATLSHVDSITGGAGQISVAGWAIWPDKPTTAVNMAIQVGQAWTSMTANVANPEAAVALPSAGPNHGFAGSLTESPGTYSVCVWAGSSVGAATDIGCKTVTVTAAPPIEAAIDSISGGTGSVSVAGWALWPSQLTVSVHMAIQIDASWYSMTANSPSTEAAAAVPGAGPNHGFSQTQAFAKGTHQVCVWATPSSGAVTDLGCQNVVVH